MRKNYSFIILPILLLGLIIPLGEFYWMCGHDEKIAFLSEKPGAEWIIYPDQPNAGLQKAIPREATFQCVFKLDEAPQKASLSLCAFKSYALFLNGQSCGNQPAQNWKSTSTFDVTGLLRDSTNEITVWVTNSLGPPALWLHFQAGQFALGTDTNWMVLRAGAGWLNTIPASQLPPIPRLGAFYANEKTGDSLMHTWFLPVIFCIISLVLVFALGHWLRSHSSSSDSTKWVYGLLVIVLIARVALFINDAPQLKRDFGFDPIQHEEYVQFIQKNHALPSPADGWEMYQPPLYYLMGAGLLDTFGQTVGSESSTFILRTINGVIGMIQCVLAMLCFRLLFPKDAEAQAVGLLITAFLPPSLYLSFYVTNEPLAGALATAAMYFFLRIIREEKQNTFLYLALGATLGAALLAKSSVLLLLPLIIIALGVRLRSHFLHDGFRTMGVLVFACLVICGWYYGMNWLHYGKLVLGNWDASSAFQFWQFPGFRTASYYCGFGKVFAAPIFSGLWSFGDGIYSTLWGDGLASGTIYLIGRPPWNYGLMNWGYLCSVPMTLILIAGIVITVIQFIQQPKCEWAVILGTIFLFGFAILFMTLRVPFYTEAKAFYALPALVPFGALATAGWDWLQKRNPALRTALWAILLVWVMSVYTAFWIRAGNPQNYLARGLGQLGQQKYPESIQSFLMAAQLDEVSAQSKNEPAYMRVGGYAHSYAAIANYSIGKTNQAIQEYQKALEINGDLPDALNNLAWLLATSPDPAVRNGPQAVKFAEHACELTEYRQTAMLDTLAAAYAETGRFDEAVATIQKAMELERQNGKRESFQNDEESLQLYQAHKPYH